MRADALRRRETIVTTARKLFAEHGDGLALETIAAHSGVGIATLYRNFPSREELAHAVAIDIVDEICRAVDAAHDARAADAATAWSALVHALVEMDLGALTDAVGSSQGDAAELRTIQSRAVSALDGLLSDLHTAGIVHDRVDALGTIVAVATVTRPQPDAIRRAAPSVQKNLVDAFLAWSRPAC
ncbi:TetR/AcrR family transcriptional regulator [Microbacterium sp. GXF6406]